MRVDEYILRNAEARPNSPALHEADRTYTYGDLAYATERIAGALAGMGIGPGSCVAYALNPGHSFFQLMLALSRLGALGAGFPTRLNAAVAGTLYGAVKPKLLVCENEALSFFARLDLPELKLLSVADLDAMASAAMPSNRAEVAAASAHADGSSPLLLIFTSGTTGTPKVACLTQENLISSALCQNERLLPGTLQPSDCLLHCFPLNHVSGAVESGLAPLFHGASAVLLPKFDPERALEGIAGHRASILCGVPAMWMQMFGVLRSRSFDLSTVRLGISGASALPDSLAQQILALCGNLINPMGMTETSGFCSYFPDSATDRQKITTCGVIYPELEHRLVDADGNAVAPGQVGELALKGKAVIGRYLNAPMRRSDGFLLTGDLGYEDADGFLHLCGRSDDMFTVGGYNVYPQEVEELISGYPGVMLSAVVPAKHPTMGSVPRAYVMPCPGAQIDTQALCAYLGQRLLPYKVPRDIRVVPQLPMNAMGKLQRSKLPKED